MEPTDNCSICHSLFNNYPSITFYNYGYIWVFFSVTQAYVFVCLLILTSRYFKKIKKIMSILYM